MLDSIYHPDIGVGVISLGKLNLLYTEGVT